MIDKLKATCSSALLAYVKDKQHKDMKIWVEAVFTKMMRLLIEPMREKSISHFMDDVLVATQTLEEHY